MCCLGNNVDEKYSCIISCRFLGVTMSLRPVYTTSLRQIKFFAFIVTKYCTCLSKNIFLIICMYLQFCMLRQTLIGTQISLRNKIYGMQYPFFTPNHSLMHIQQRNFNSTLLLIRFCKVLLLLKVTQYVYGSINAYTCSVKDSLTYNQVACS